MIIFLKFIAYKYAKELASGERNPNAVKAYITSAKLKFNLLKDIGQFDTAQICLNGHVITSISSYSEQRKRFCPKCGKQTTQTCLKCYSEIKGYYHVDNVISFSNYSTHAFCDNCGEAYPWTERARKAAHDIIHFSETLSFDEMIELDNSIQELIKDSPQSKLAELDFKKYAAKAGKEVANGLRDILIDIVSETLKKSIWG